MGIFKKEAPKKAPAKAKAEKKVVELVPCGDCSGGLRDANTLCSTCEGRGKL